MKEKWEYLEHKFKASYYKFFYDFFFVLYACVVLLCEKNKFHELCNQKPQPVSFAKYFCIN